jgi:hypothetical protein
LLQFLSGSYASSIRLSIYVCRMRIELGIELKEEESDGNITLEANESKA